MEDTGNQEPSNANKDDRAASDARHAADIPALLPNQKLDLTGIRHPGERWFLAVIVGCNVIAGAGVLGIVVLVPQMLITLCIAGAVLFVVHKLAYVLLYWHLYGHSVLVGPAQYPEIYRAVQRSCELLDLKPHPKVFVLHGNGIIELFLIKRFTKRGLLVFTAEAVDTLLQQDSRQFMMIIGRQLGHIKAGHFRGWIFKDVVGRLALWCHSAWWHRCHYTADRVGFLVAGNLAAAQRALVAVTVGKTLSSATNLDAIREQDSELRSSFFAWLRKIHSEYPFMINRIIELESFCGYVRTQTISKSAPKAIGCLPRDVSVFVVHAHGPTMIGDKNLMRVAIPGAERAEVANVQQQIQD